jgi:nucleoredoxin
MSSSTAAVTDAVTSTTAYKTVEDLIGSTLHAKTKGSTTIETCPTVSIPKNKQYLLLYFSASWCPPCQSFTPMLVDFYTKHKDIVEVIYISSDRNKEEFMQYYTKKMPWYTLHPFDEKATEQAATMRRKLPTLFQIKGLPTLIVLDISTCTNKDGFIKFVTHDGRMDIMTHANQYEKVLAKWKSNTTPHVSIEEGIIKINQGDGSMWFIMTQLFKTFAQNPLYIVATLYLIQVYSKKFLAMIMTSDSNTALGNATEPSIPLQEPVYEDEF